MSFCYVPDTTLGTGNTSVYNVDTVCFYRVSALVKIFKTKQCVSSQCYKWYNGEVQVHMAETPYSHWVGQQWVGFSGKSV